MKTARPLILMLSVLTITGILLHKEFFQEQAATLAAAPQPVSRSGTPAPATTSTAPHTAAAVPSSSVEKGQRMFTVQSWALQQPDLSPLAPGESAASRMVKARATLQPGSLPLLSSLKAGDELWIPVRGASAVQARVNLVKVEPSGSIRVGGGLISGGKGSFSLGQKGQAYHGLILLEDKNTAYLLTSAENGDVTLLEKPLSSVRCQGMKPKPRPDSLAEAAPSAPATTVPNTGSSASITVPLLDSVPNSSHVIYLDFDGELVEVPEWNNGFSVRAEPARLGAAFITSAQMTDVWKRVSEDFRPFNISVTTVRSRYDSAPPGQRMKCVITSTNYWFPGAGGVAYLTSYDTSGSDFSDDVPAWTFTETYYNTADVSSIISHEIGHTLGLSHDSVLNADRDLVLQEYYDGHGRWAPIMGAGYDKAITQWSICEFRNGGNFDGSAAFAEDDLAIISNASNGFGYLTPSAPPSGTLNTGTFSQQSILVERNSSYSFNFSTRGGALSLLASPAVVEPNLDIQLELRSLPSLTLVATANPTGNLSASIIRTLTAGDYQVTARPSGDGSPLSTGYSTYGSVGELRITGSFPAVADAAPTITQEPQSLTAPAGTRATFTVIAASNTPLTYQWQKNGTNITGATAASYSIPAVTGALHGAEYRCLVTNLHSTTTSSAATLSVNFKPTISTQPVATTVAAGSPFLQLSVVAQGTATLSYQWQKASVNLVGQTSAQLSISNPQFSDSGVYRCIVSNTFGSITSAAVTATVTSAPVITQQPPTAQGVPRGGSASISLTAVGSPTLRYQWYKNSTAIPLATRAILSLAAITDSAAGSYHCEVKNTVGSTVNTTISDPCTITVGAAPRITTAPTAQTLDEGSILNLGCIATGDPTLGYQWQRDGVDLPGATQSTYSDSSLQWSERGSYRVKVSNSFGTATSTAALITVRAAAQIITPPSSRKVARGARTTLSVVAGGSPTLRYAWSKDGSPITGATAASLIVIGTSTASYTVSVSNSIGTAAVSTAATVTVEDAPKMTAMPAISYGALGLPYTLTPSITGSATLAYQWKKNGIALPSQTSATLSLPSLLASDAGLYTLTVTNDVGTTTSTATRLIPQTAPSITVDPSSTTVSAFAHTTFTTAATGTATLRYQWRKDGSPITGATAASYSIASTQEAHAGLYDVIVTNSAGSVQSTAAQLTVLSVTAPTITSYSPPLVRAGQYIRLLGTNLQWTTAVQFEKTALLKVNAAFVIVSSEELLITVPVGTLASSSITLVGRAGVATSSTNVSITPLPSNDLLENATIISGTGGVSRGTVPSTFTPEVDEQEHHLESTSSPAATFSAWLSFTPTITGTFALSTAGSAFDTVLNVYTGEGHVNHQRVSYNDDLDYESSITYSYLRLDVTAGTTYYIAIDGWPEYDDGFGNIDPPQFGAYTLTVSKLNLALAPQRTALAALHYLSGPQNRAATVVSQRSLLRYTAPSSTQDQLLLRVKDSPAALVLDAASGQLSLLGSSSPFHTQQLLPGEDYEVTLLTDGSSWGLALNGECICHDLPLPAKSQPAVLEARVLRGRSAAAASFTVQEAPLPAGP